MEGDHYRRGERSGKLELWLILGLIVFVVVRLFLHEPAEQGAPT